MPFIAVHVAGTITSEEKAAVIADITRSMVERLGKPAAAVQIAIHEIPLDSYGASGEPISVRLAPPKEVASADEPR